MSGSVVRRAELGDLLQLPAVEAAADSLFVPLGITDLPAPGTPADWSHAWRVLVVGRPVVGFAVLESLDGAVHLEQLSVHPAHGRRGHGGALLAATVEAARERGADRVTLLTYADVPWNAPFYARHGWRTTTSLTPGLRARRARELELGLDRHGARVAMVRIIAPGPDAGPDQDPCCRPTTGSPSSAGTRSRGRGRRPEVAVGPPSPVRRPTRRATEEEVRSAT